MLKASDANLWVSCPLAGKVCMGGVAAAHPAAPDEHETDARKEGTAAHWVAELMFADKHPAAGATAPNGWIIDGEMIMHARAYVDHALEHGEMIGSEKSYVIGGLVTGRVDTALYDVDTGLHIFDFKYGYKLVEVDEEWPLVCHMAGLWRGAGNVTLHVYQPRPNHPDGPARSITYPADAVQRMRDHITQKAINASAPGGQIGAPGAHCRKEYCAAAGVCHALTASTYAAFERVRDSRMVKLSAEELSNERRFLIMATEMVRGRLTGIDAEMKGRMLAGEFMPGHVLEPRFGHRKHTTTPEMRQRITGRDPFKRVEKSPADLQKEGVPKDTMDLIAIAPRIGMEITEHTTRAGDRLFKKGKK